MSNISLFMELNEQIDDAIRQGVPKQDVQLLIDERDKIQRVMNHLVSDKPYMDVYYREEEQDDKN